MVAEYAKGLGLIGDGKDVSYVDDLYLENQ